MTLRGVFISCVESLIKRFKAVIALVDGKPKLLSTFKYIYEALGIESHEEDEFLYK